MNKTIAALLFACFSFPAFAQSEKDGENIDPEFTLSPEEEFGETDPEYTISPEEEFGEIDPEFTISADEEGETYPTLDHSVSTTGFWSNWFVQAGFDWGAFYSDEERGLELSKSPFRSFRATPYVSLAFGKYITPNFALRLKMQGFWGRTVKSGTADWNSNRNFNFQLQPMLNLTNVFCGYKESRVWDMSVFCGTGFNYSSKSKIHTISFSAGLHSSWKVSQRFNVYGEFGLVMNEPVADGVSSGKPRSNNLWRNHDNTLYAEVGVQYNFSRLVWKKSVDIDAVNMLHQAEIDALNAQISDLKAEAERLGRKKSSSRK